MLSTGIWTTLYLSETVILLLLKWWDYSFVFISEIFHETCCLLLPEYCTRTLEPIIVNFFFYSKPSTSDNFLLKCQVKVHYLINNKKKTSLGCFVKKKILGKVMDMKIKRKKFCSNEYLFLLNTNFVCII